MRNTKLLNKACLWGRRALPQFTVSRRTNNAGRCSTGRLVCYTKGTRTRNRIRNICNSGIFYNIPGIIMRIEYDPNRSGLISLVRFANNICHYRLLATGLKIGDIITSYVDVGEYIKQNVSASFNTGDWCRLVNMPRGVIVHNVAQHLGVGGSIARSAGCFSILLYKFTAIFMCLLKMPSGLQLTVNGLSGACKGVVSNSMHKFVSLGKAGRAR